MKKLLAIVIVAFAALFVLTPAITFADDLTGVGPAPNAGDGTPDGSGFRCLDWDDPECNDDWLDEWPNDVMGPGSGVGPAPSSGDGVPDGSGF